MTATTDGNSTDVIGKTQPGSDGAYKPTPQEKAALERLRDRQKRDKPAPRFNVTYEGNIVSYKADHPVEDYGSVLLTDTFCSADPAFLTGLMNQVANLARTGKQLTSGELNFMLSMVNAIGPRDPIEALLAVQMAAIYNATTVAARRLTHCENIPQQDSASNMLNKLTRTFAAQVEALNRYRSTGEQNIRVQHVSVNASQAVVGISQGGGGAHENASQSHAPRESRPDERRPALLGNEQALGVPVPGTGREGPKRVPHARRASRSAEREG